MSKQAVYASISASNMKFMSGLLKIVKPRTSDYVLKFYKDGLSAASNDGRKRIRVNIPYTKSCIQTDMRDIYIHVDRVSVLSQNDDADFFFDEKSINLSYKSKSSVKNTYIRYRDELSKRTPMPADKIRTGDEYKIKELTRVLGQMMFSSSSDTTKTEEDMRINQVFFLSSGAVVANSRFNASVGRMDCIKSDFNVVSSDIPLILSFLSKLNDDIVIVSSSDKELVFIDRSTNSSLLLYKVVCKSSHNFSGFIESDFVNSITIDRQALKEFMSWSETSIEGTKKLTIAVSGDVMTATSNKNHITECTVLNNNHTDFKLDVSMPTLSGLISSSGDSKTVTIGYSSVLSKHLIEVYGDNGIKHYTQAMV